MKFMYKGKRNKSNQQAHDFRIIFVIEIHYRMLPYLLNNCHFSSCSPIENYIIEN